MKNIKKQQIAGSEIKKNIKKSNNYNFLCYKQKQFDRKQAEPDKKFYFFVF